MAIGSYHVGNYYCSAASSIQQDFLAFTTRSGVGRKGSMSPLSTVLGGAQNTMRLISCLHEIGHYVHDLSIGASLVADDLRDQSAQLLFDCLRVSGGANPIFAPMAERHNSAFSAERFHALTLSRKLFELGTHLVGNDNRKGPYRPTALSTRSGTILSPSSLELMEGVVATQTALSLVMRCADAEDFEHLRNLKSQILPEALSPLYNAARKLFDAQIGIEMGLGGYESDQWPFDYLHGSTRINGDLAFSFIADIALHIPPLWLQQAKIDEGLNKPSDFIPSERFLWSLGAIRRQGGFVNERNTQSPDHQNRVSNLYRDIFNKVATDPLLNWPSYEETTAAWLANFKHLKEASRADPSTGYKFRMAAERDDNPAHMALGNIHADPIDLCLRLKIPMHVLSRTGFKIFAPGANRQNEDGSTAIISSAFEWPDALPFTILQHEPIFWRDPKIPEEVVMVAQGFHQEIVNRAFCRSLQEAVYYDEVLECPFAAAGCSNARPGCKTLTSLDDAPQDSCGFRLYIHAKGFRVDAIKWGPTT